MQLISLAIGRAAMGAAFLILAITPARAQSVSKAFSFTTFNITGAVSLSVESIDNSGLVSGYYTDSASDVISFIRNSSGAVRTYTEPEDTTTPGFTEGGQINTSGAVAGEFYDTSIATYIGYVYKSSSSTFVTYQVPNEPADTTTGLVGINDKGEICGFVLPPPYSLQSAFIESGGTVTTFSVNGSATTGCFAVNNSGTTVGYDVDANGVYHGWMRTSSGTVTDIDVPGAATTVGTAPCISVSVGGTVPLGINNSGYVSGHYWDTSYNEHGFLMTPTGTFYEINVPGAYQTSAGGLNDHVDVVGHYANSACADSGYIATP